jgi:hypothetical protein
MMNCSLKCFSVVNEKENVRNRGGKSPHGMRVKSGTPRLKPCPCPLTGTTDARVEYASVTMVWCYLEFLIICIISLSCSAKISSPSSGPSGLTGRSTVFTCMGYLASPIFPAQSKSTNINRILSFDTIMFASRISPCTKSFQCISFNFSSIASKIGWDLGSS